MEQDIRQYYDTQYPGQVQVLGPDIYNGTAGLLQTFQTATGATYPLLLNAATPTGGNLGTLYGPFDDYVVISKQGIVRYHAALIWPHGNRYHLDQIRGCVDTLVSSTAGVGDVEPRARGFTLGAAPNPFRATAAIELSRPTTASAHARIAVHDLSGREVAKLWDGPASSGVTRVSWDGRTREGGVAPPGVYLIRAELEGLRLSRRIVFLR